MDGWSTTGGWRTRRSHEHGRRTWRGQGTWRGQRTWVRVWLGLVLASGVIGCRMSEPGIPTGNVIGEVPRPPPGCGAFYVLTVDPPCPSGNVNPGGDGSESCSYAANRRELTVEMVPPFDGRDRLDCKFDCGTFSLVVADHVDGRRPAGNWFSLGPPCDPYATTFPGTQLYSIPARPPVPAPDPVPVPVPDPVPSPVPR
jgi:hypothetical protein